MYRILTLLTIITIFAGCGGKQVTRIAPDTTVDFSGRWNDTDSRLVAQEMIDDCLGHRWITDHISTTQGKPVVIVGNIRNKSGEHTATQTFISDIERAFINSGKVRLGCCSGAIHCAMGEAMNRLTTNWVYPSFEG